MGRAVGAGKTAAVLRLARLTLRVFRIYAAMAMRNACFLARERALATPGARRDVMAGLGGARALHLWRRKAIWNKARAEAIARGEIAAVKPARKARVKVRVKPNADLPDTFKAPPEPGETPAHFRLPVIADPSVQGGFGICGPRAPAQPRYPSIVIYPHELDGQYVPDFISRASYPPADIQGKFQAETGMHAPAAAAKGPPRRAPP